MKKIFLLISLFLVGYLSSFSQGSCAGAAPFCTATGVNFPASTSTTAPVGPNYGCLGSEPNPAWYYLNIATSGNVQIQISSAPAVDIDFALWGPFATQASMCAGISASPIDCSYSTAATEQIDITGAVAGQWYMMLITNFSGLPTNITAVAENAPGTDGTTNCAILCNMTGLTAVPGACNPATNLYTLSGTITTTTPPSTGTLTITNSCGGSTVLSPPFATSIAYSFPGMTSNGAGCSITATYSADPTCTLTTPYTAPAACTGSCIATATNTGPYCAGATIQLNSTGGGTYSWSGPGAYSSTLQNPTRPASTTAMSGTYTVTVTSGALTCTAITTVTVNPLPTLTAEPNQTYCAGAAVPLNTFASTPAGATFTWTNSNTAIGLAASGVTSTPAFTATNATGAAITSTITITPTLGGCVGPTSTFTITVNPNPTVVAEPNLTFCAGATVPANTFVSVPAGATFAWTNSNTTIGLAASGVTSTPAFTAINATGAPITSTVTITPTLAGCPGTPITYTITVNPLPITTVNSPTICPGGTATLTGAGATTYTWSTGAVTNPINVTPGATTSYTVTGTTATCTSTAVAIVTVGSSITPTVNSPTICNGATTALTATGGTTYAWSTGAVTNPINVTPATTTSYTVTATTGGCTGTAVATVTVNPIPVTTVNSLTICAGATATLTGAGAATYAWSTGAVTNPIIVTPATTTSYTVTGTSLGCTSTAVSTVTVNPLPVTTVNSPTICPGGTATLTGAGATTYVWSTGALINPINVTPAATTSYTVTGTTAGCTSTAVATVTIGAGITPTVNSPTICAGAIAALTATGGTTYAWSDGSITNPTNVTPATTTSYTVTATAGGCTGTAVATVTVNPLPVTTVNSPTICNGATATLTGAGATTYSWSTGAISNPITVTPATTTSYTVTGTSLGCTSTAVSTVTVNPIPVTTVNSPTICPASIATLTAGGATTYAWSTGAVTNSISVTPASTATYTVTGSSLGCTSSAVSTVTVAAGLVVNAGLDDSVCFGMNTILNVTPNGVGYTYNWTPAASLTGATTFNPTATPAATTTYSVTVTDAGGCTGTSTVTVFADPQITMAIAGIDVTCNGACNGQTIVIPAGGTPAYSYAWTSGCTAASCTSLCPGTYTVTITDSWGCTASGNATVIQPTLLTASVTATTPTSCNGVCDGTATAAGAGGTVGYTYSWNTVPAQATATATGLCAGTYTCTVTDANGCTATTTATITEPTLVVIAPITAATVCTGGSTVITASASGGNGGAYVYTWTPPAGLSATNIANPTATPAATTVYTVNATDVNGCPAAAVTVTVTVNPPLTVLASGSTSICPGASANISSLASLGTGGPYTYTWLPAGTASGSPVSVSPATTTTYTVTASDGCSPTATSTVTITVLPLPTVAFTAPITSGCAPLCVNFIDNSTVTGGAIATWAWSFGDGNTASTNAPSNCYNNPGSYDVTLTVTSTLGGCTSTNTITSYVTVYPNPVADFTAPLSTSIIDPTVPFTDNSTNANSWTWNFGDPLSTGDTSHIENPTYIYTDAGTYCVDLTVTSINGCVDNTQLCIVIDPEFTFFIPNAFSPNEDGINDKFFGSGIGIKTYELYVYDRWGNLIFFADELNKTWDGKANHGSQMAQQDVYVWKVKLTDVFDKKHSYIGTVTIVK